jgi:hypothetical protein
MRNTAKQAKSTNASESQSPIHPDARARGKTRNTQISTGTTLRQIAQSRSPKIAGELLSGGPVSFVVFITQPEYEPFIRLVCGEHGTAAAKMLAEFRKAKKLPRYFYGNLGNLEDHSPRRRELKRFARRAYRGDSESRGVTFWERVAWLLWNAYDSLMALRSRAEKIQLQESARIGQLAKKRAARAAYMRDYRKRRATNRDAKKTVHFKADAIQRWRRQRQASPGAKPKPRGKSS